MKPTVVQKPKNEQPLNIERMIKLNVTQKDSKFSIRSEGMDKLDKPELVMTVGESIYVASACRIMNDVARYMVERDKCPRTGQRVQLRDWTVVEFLERGSGELEVIDAEHALTAEGQ